MRSRPSGIRLTAEDAALIKGMRKRGDRQHDIAAYFGVNPGRIAEIIKCCEFSWVKPATDDQLPEPGPYPSGRQMEEMRRQLDAALAVLAEMESTIHRRGRGSPPGDPDLFDGCA